MRFSHRRSWFRHVGDGKTRKTREKEKVFLDAFGSFLVIGVYSEINNITGFSPHLEIESLVSVSPFGLWCTYKGTLIPSMLL